MTRDELVKIIKDSEFQKVIKEYFIEIIKTDGDFRAQIIQSLQDVIVLQEISESKKVQTQILERIEKFEQTQTQILERIEKLEQTQTQILERIEKLEQNQTQILERIEKLEQNQTQILERIEKLEQNQTQILERIEKLEQNQTQILERIEKLEQNQIMILNTIKELQTTVGRLSDRVEELQTTVGKLSDRVEGLQITVGRLGENVGAWFEGLIAIVFPRWLKIKYNIEVTQLTQYSKGELEVNYLLYGKQDGQEIILFVETVTRCWVGDIRDFAEKRALLENQINKKVKAFAITQWLMGPVQEEAQKHNIELLTYPLILFDLSKT